MRSNLLRYYNTYGTAIIVAEIESYFRITTATLYLAFTGELFWVSIVRILEKIDRVIATLRRTSKKTRKRNTHVALIKVIRQEQWLSRPEEHVSLGGDEDAKFDNSAWYPCLFWRQYLINQSGSNYVAYYFMKKRYKVYAASNLFKMTTTIFDFILRKTIWLTY